MTLNAKPIGLDPDPLFLSGPLENDEKWAPAGGSRGKKNTWQRGSPAQNTPQNDRRDALVILRDMR